MTSYRIGWREALFPTPYFVVALLLHSSICHLLELTGHLWAEALLLKGSLDVSRGCQTEHKSQLLLIGDWGERRGHVPLTSHN